MSDVSQLTHEYHRESALSEQINSAIIDLHKARLGQTTHEDVAASGRALATIIDGLLNLLKPDAACRVTPEMAARVPAALVARVQEERRGDLAHYVEDLERVATLLHDRPEHLAAEDLALLDSVASAADTEASRVFRRLMRV